RPRQVVGPPVVVDVRSEVGDSLRLAEAILLLDGEKVAHRKAPTDGELERAFRLWFSGAPATPGAPRSDDPGLPVGEHAMTVELAYEGRPIGFITYMTAYKHRVNVNFVFTIEPGSRPVSIRIIG